jgi:hypothetical protein
MAWQWRPLMWSVKHTKRSPCQGSTKATIWPLATHRRQPIDLVEEDDGGLVALRLLKQRLELALSLAHPLGQHVRALAHEERHLAPGAAGVGSECTRHQRLASACEGCSTQRRHGHVS